MMQQIDCCDVTGVQGLSYYVNGDWRCCYQGFRKYVQESTSAQTVKLFWTVGIEVSQRLVPQECAIKDLSGPCSLFT